MLKTEQRNPKTTHIDRMDTAEMIRIIQEENKVAVNAIDAELERISLAVDAISSRMKAGGRLFYIGCGTSGRLGVLDASECPPTYGVSHDLVIGIIAGGDGALRKAAENAEDSREAGRRDLSAYGLCEKDSVIGISAAGGAEYVISALTYAKEQGALTVALTCNADSPLEQISDIAIHPDTGAEVITGSTRMKAGSAHKMILNMISTAVMVKQGYVYENMMVNLKPTNVKLRARMIRIVGEITGALPDVAEKLLEQNGFSIPAAVEAYRRSDS
ncbi:MAG: N-acetylmuramic acid 6-phosphate etherase [Clostridia bacterium]|nr:N-acetylmuramic acid 6-phosphate etherase [Clostridia bacterium]